MAENFPRSVPVFMADVKGDPNGISQAGAIGERWPPSSGDRALDLPKCIARPVTLGGVWRAGHPVRATVSDMGPVAAGPHAEPQ
ncbi:helicase HerA-like domain-containing protein [Candidatus Skiveiella danica]|uniref:helicase HerA-like domain-containing protein n=1 Tax=Candidatus Skiveiella danica TaxID=3386177 RepID=UPI0039B839E7